MKFTEEQYQKIVSAWDFEDTYAEATQAVIDVISVFTTEFLEDEALAIANPVTREWAHERFVEKEKKYYWNSINIDSADNHLRLFRHENGGISAYSRLEPANNINEDEQLTESEIKEWGYNPEMFDKEEVE